MSLADELFIGDSKSWDSLVEQFPSSHFFQSWAWGKAMEALNWKVERIVFRKSQALIGLATCLRRGKLGMGFDYIPRGPLFQNENDLHEILKLLKKRSQSSLFLKINPARTDSSSLSNIFKSEGFRASSKPAAYSETIVLDLIKPEEELWDEFRKSFRYDIRQAEKTGVQTRSLETEADIHNFAALHQEMSQLKKLPIVNESFFQTLWRELGTDILFQGAFRDSEMVAGAAVLMHKQSAYYSWGASKRTSQGDSGAKLLHWDVMRWAKKKGFTEYDLGGIDAKKNPGVALFKEGFGGEKRKWIGDFDWSGKPLLFKLYRILSF
jgi:lipid II:glycine glycyltransferase (peptidoglycan interpeptide bridge formation enzyme)